MIDSIPHCTLTWILVIICVYFLGLNHLITPISLILVGAIFVYNPCLYAMCLVYGIK